eukprot:CAMPEP_0195647596 /NCGR_PEP_ID=MMETSP0815-20121206/30179_1 /TAXON_ID=97485 /ORGANISM="Prymnesium parvum, Strain Texoma1" /LENGTH=42 /DNA_ID= /DNA_START= /DNA_END= /DNA_ORIENTATION=
MTHESEERTAGPVPDVAVDNIAHGATPIVRCQQNSDLTCAHE